eukprot:CAMPEP_0182426920 /NCGR_PEP_ID=MMETSP1167-20130531/13444_1 /TAXON_ID=2988 /ORGANISM="Mallomonas Sp, Strain CCMP3275" /LENGTH=303 /DNA_ID=CAMNT_0024608693 /DNA_START=74 /DNA_END=982 /DNA_ORIENTATION=+
MSVTLDSSGNIDTEKLSKELQNALDFDIKYKKVDNMKKKAVKISKDYDEFKNFVACAHLKTLSRKEVESLGDAKKGWQKSSVVRKPGANVLSDEKKKEKIAQSATIPNQQKFRRPKTSLELDRDWRRLSNDNKINYLIKVGIIRVKKLLQTDCDTSILEDILRTLLIAAESLKDKQLEASFMRDSQSELVNVSEVESSGGVSPEAVSETEMLPGTSTETQQGPESMAPLNKEVSHSQKESEKLSSVGDACHSQSLSEEKSELVMKQISKELLLEWFIAITTFQRFSLNIQFVEAAIKKDIVKW